MTKANWTFGLRGEGTETLEIDIYDVIGESFWSDGVSAKDVRAQLKAAKGANLIKLRVNSRGGDVIDGFAIYNLLNEHPARVEADVDALAASMASVVLMAADEVRIGANGFVMIHNPWGVSIGEADDLRATADLLDKMAEQIAAAYTAHTGLERARILEMMAAETWMTAAEAKELGFVDKVRPAKKGTTKKDQVKALAGLDLSDLLHVPRGLLAAVAQARSEVSSPAARRGPAINIADDGGGDNEENDMADDQKQVLAALGVATVAEAATRLALLTRLEALAGETGEAALGVFSAMAQSHKTLPTVQARVAELEVQVQAGAIDALIARGTAENKITPALEQSIRAQIAAGDMTIKGAETMVANLPTIAALGSKDKQPPKKGPDGGTGGPTPTWNGKTYAELKPVERAQLKEQHPELFAEMRQGFNAAAR